MATENKEEEEKATVTPADIDPNESSNPVIAYRVQKVEGDVVEIKDSLTVLKNEMTRQFDELKEGQSGTQKTQARTGRTNGIITFITGITIWLLNKVFNFFMTGNPHRD